MAHAGGRPQKVTPELVSKAWGYIDDIEASGSLPTIEQLAFKLDLSRETLYAREEFSDILEKVRQIQAHQLVTRGLDGTYNSTIAKLLLSSKHGYVEKSDITSGGASISPVLVKFLDDDVSDDPATADN